MLLRIHIYELHIAKTASRFFIPRHCRKTKRVREKIKVLTPLIKLRLRYCDVWIVKRLSVGYNQHSKIKLSVKRKILVGDNKIIKSAVFLEVNMCIRNKWTELGNLPGGGGGGGGAFYKGVAYKKWRVLKFLHCLKWVCQPVFCSCSCAFDSI